MTHLVVRAAFILTIVAFIWSSDVFVGLLLAIAALVWAVMPALPRNDDVGVRERSRLRPE
jgi:hypothetical protein